MQKISQSVGGIASKSRIVWTILHAIAVFRRFRVRIPLGLILAGLCIPTIAVQAQQRGRGQAAPEPRITTFEARPTSVRAGEPVVLVWSTENPTGLTIDPDIGPVAARGTKQVIPSATTTYTLAMRNGPSKTVTVTVAGTRPASAAAISAPANVNKKDPRLPDGKPDLTGVYNFAGLPAGTPEPALKPGAEKYLIVRGPNDVR